MFSSSTRTFRPLLALLCLLGATAARASAVADLDADCGLPNARLGAPLSSFAGLHKTEDTGRWLSFDRPGDKLEFAGVGLKAITYNFFKERLYSINLELEGKREIRGMLKTLKKRYGTVYTYEAKTYTGTNAQMAVREWKGVKAYCVFKSAADETGAELVLLDRPTWDLLQVPRQERAAMSREMLKGSYTNGDF